MYTILEITFRAISIMILWSVVPAIENKLFARSAPKAHQPRQKGQNSEISVYYGTNFKECETILCMRRIYIFVTSYPRWYKYILEDI